MAEKQMMKIAGIIWISVRAKRKLGSMSKSRLTRVNVQGDGICTVRASEWLGRRQYLEQYISSETTYYRLLASLEPNEHVLLANVPQLELKSASLQRWIHGMLPQAELESTVYQLEVDVECMACCLEQSYN